MISNGKIPKMGRVVFRDSKMRHLGLMARYELGPRPLCRPEVKSAYVESVSKAVRMPLCGHCIARLRSLNAAAGTEQ